MVFVFYGPLDENLVGTSGYNFYEVAEAIKDRPLKVVNNSVIVDFQREYNDKVEYQKEIDWTNAIQQAFLAECLLQYQKDFFGV